MRVKSSTKLCNVIGPGFQIYDEVAGVELINVQFQYSIQKRCLR